MRKNQSLKLVVFDVWASTDMEIPALIARVPAGEAMELGSEVEWIDLNYLLLKNSPDAMVLRVEGESMCPEIADGDWIVVSRSLQPQIGDIVVASVNGCHTLKRLKLKDVKGKRGLYLVPSNGLLQPREVTAADDFKVLAVVVNVIHKLR